MTSHLNWAESVSTWYRHDSVVHSGENVWGINILVVSIIGDYKQWNMG